MNVKRFSAPNSRECLRQVKEALGPEAIVLSNRAVDGGVEILAAPPESLDVFDHYADDPLGAEEGADFTVDFSPAAFRNRRGDANFDALMRPAPAREAPSPAQAAQRDARREAPREMKREAQQQAPRDTSREYAREFARDLDAAREAAPHREVPVRRSAEPLADIPPSVPSPASLRARRNAEAAMRSAERQDLLKASLPIQSRGEGHAGAEESGRAVPRTRVETSRPALAAPQVRRSSRTPRSVELNRPDEPLLLPEPPKTEAPAAEPPTAKVEMRESPAVQSLVTEFKAFKSLMEQHVGGLAWRDFSADQPQRALMMGELLDAGFSTLLARELVGGVRDNVDLDTARGDVRDMLNQQLGLPENGADLIEQGGVIALVGPTGVGKTTTTAKLAARFVERHGADSVAMLTTDNYRIGAHEQLRIYGRILGVSVHAVRDALGLRQMVEDLQDKKLVLIDTVGMGQRDRRMESQAEMLDAPGCGVRRLLLLNATSNGDTLDEVVRAYAGDGLAGAILTKVDEATCLGSALDVLVRHRLVMQYICNGQRVPEDLHLPNRAYVLHRSMKPRREESPFHLGKGERSVAIAASLSRELFAQGGAHA